jgi:hypothetical protein
MALLDRRERYHRSCAQALEAVAATPLVPCEAVIAESCYEVCRELLIPSWKMSREERSKFHFNSPVPLRKFSASSENTATRKSISPTPA